MQEIKLQFGHEKYAPSPASKVVSWKRLSMQFGTYADSMQNLEQDQSDNMTKCYTSGPEANFSLDFPRKKRQREY